MNIKNAKKGYTLVEVMVSTAVLSVVIILIFRLYSYGNSIFNYNYWQQSRTREVEIFYEFLRNDVDRAANRNQAGYTTIMGYMVKAITTTPCPVHYYDNGGAYFLLNSTSENKLLEFEMNEADTSGLYSTMSDEAWSIGKTISVQYTYQKGTIYKTRTITHPAPIQVIESRNKVLEDVEKVKIYKDNDPALDGNVLKFALILKHPTRNKYFEAEASFSIKVPFSPETSSWMWYY